MTCLRMNSDSMAKPVLCHAGAGVQSVSLSTCSLSSCTAPPDTVPGTEDKAVNQTEKAPALLELTFQAGRKTVNINIHIQGQVGIRSAPKHTGT